MVVFCISTTIGCIIKHLVAYFLNMKLLLSMFKVDKLSAFLYVPYVMWLLFASYLNLFIVINN